jgi:tetratricopeptide (TPR) repeat protein
VARVLAAIGRPEEAVSLAESVTEDEQTLTAARVAGMRASVAEALADAGNTDEAVRLAQRAADLARTEQDGSERAPVLADVARALAKAGHPDQAAEVAHTITEPLPQAAALAAAAQTRGRTAEGASLLRWALSLRTHETFLKELAVVCPEALDEALRCVGPPAA